WLMLKIQCGIYFLYLSYRFTTLSYANQLIILIYHCSGYELLSIHNPLYVRPFILDSLSFKLMAQRVNGPIGQDTQMQVSHGGIISLVINGSKVEIAF